LKKKSKKDVSWKTHFCILIGGTFIWYKSSFVLEEQPLGFCNLVDVEIEEEEELNSDRPRFFVLKIKGEPVFTGYVHDEVVMETWENILKENKELYSPIDNPDRIFKGKKTKKKGLVKELKSLKKGLSMIMQMKSYYYLKKQLKKSYHPRKEMNWSKIFLNYQEKSQH